MNTIKKVIFISLLQIFSFQAYSQINTWRLVIDNNFDMAVYEIINNNNNEYLLTVRQNLPDSKYIKSIIYKINSSGLLTDSTLIQKTDTSILASKIITKYDTVLFCLFYSDTINKSNAGFILSKINNNLELTEEKKFFFQKEFKKLSLFCDYGLDSNILVHGSYFNPNKPLMLIYETNLNFDSIQARLYPNAGAIFIFGIKQLTNKNFWLIRGVHSNYVLVDSSLNLISAEQGALPRWVSGNYGIKWDSDTSFYLAGDYIPDTKSSPRFTDHDIAFFHQFDPFDSTGVVFNSWGSHDTIDFPAYWSALDYQNKDSIFIGATKNLQITNPNFANVNSWYVLLQTDSMLNVRWEHFYGGDAYYTLGKVTATKDGGCIMAGSRFDYKAHSGVRERDIYIVKVNAEGLITNTHKHENKFVHDAIVYPNPGSNNIQVRVAMQHPRSVFRLFDISGQLVMEHDINGKTAQFNTSFLKAGTYVYSITGKKGLNENGKWVKR